VNRPNHSPTIRAAGGLVIRGDTPATAEVIVVHRPRYDDWSIPKGKHDRGETSQECAVREVEEETGYRGRIIGTAGTTRYRARGRPKQVDYFLMRPFRSSGFRPDDEVDEMRWVTPEEALGLLTYDFDRELIESLPLDLALSHTTIHLVRHSAAGARSRWEGPDAERPLTSKGLAQSKALADELGDVGIGRILTSPYVRCVETVAPLGESTGLDLELSDDLAEGAGPGQIDRLLEEVSGSTVVLCSHGDVIPALLERLQRMGTRFLSPYVSKKGSTWVVGHDGTSFTEAVYVPPP
jgi:broad specificity phosphatase PhoE/ADP-ribose pyrophosphatase YjhB (NUDIX family)